MGRKNHSINAITANRVFMLRLKNDAWNVEVLSILKSFINPRFYYLGTHLDLFVLWLEPRTLRLYHLQIISFRKGFLLSSGVSPAVHFKADASLGSVGLKFLSVKMHGVSKFLTNNRNIKEPFKGGLLHFLHWSDSRKLESWGINRVTLSYSSFIWWD